jgi:carbonic anhydrase
LSENIKPESLELVSEKQFDYIGEQTDVLVIYCADPRFRDTFREFIGEELGVKHYIVRSLAGAAGPCVQCEPESEKAKQMINQIKLFVDKACVKKLIVMNHTDCKWYSNAMSESDTEKIISKQIEDLKQFADLVRDEIANIPVKKFLAVLSNNSVQFKKVP